MLINDKLEVADLIAKKDFRISRRWGWQVCVNGRLFLEACNVWFSTEQSYLTRYFVDEVTETNFYIVLTC